MSISMLIRERVKKTTGTVNLLMDKLELRLDHWAKASVTIIPNDPGKTRTNFPAWKVVTKTPISLYNT
jgi:hypothetical protein